jgi:hypothetical protein
MNEIMAHPLILIGLASILKNKISSILFIIPFSSKNIVHPWPCDKIFFYVTKYSNPCLQKDSIDVNKIFWKRFIWALVEVHVFTVHVHRLTIMACGVLIAPSYFAQNCSQQ